MKTWEWQCAEDQIAFGPRIQSEQPPPKEHAPTCCLCNKPMTAVVRVDIIKLANFTLHEQHNYTEQWKSFGFDIDPTPRAPVVDTLPWPKESLICSSVYLALIKIRDEGFGGILIGGLSNEMAYAWAIANNLNLRVFLAQTPRERTTDGNFVFHLVGYQEMLPLEMVTRLF